jgi:hypothetical protein
MSDRSDITSEIDRDDKIDAVKMPQGCWFGSAEKTK